MAEHHSAHTIYPLDDRIAFAIDIGGSLAKVAYRVIHRRRATSFTQSDPSSDASNRIEFPYQATDDDIDQPSLQLCYFETTKLIDCLRFLKQQMPLPNSLEYVNVTGGGAFKFVELIESELSLSVRKLNEMDCLIRGANFLLSNIEDESFAFLPPPVEPSRLYKKEPLTYPYLLVNIGSGVSLLRVDGPAKFERIDGSAVGGGTFWGLAALLTQCDNFNDLLQLASQGNAGNVDMVVKDIYGDDTPSSLGLDPNLTASCLAKAARTAAQINDDTDDNSDKSKQQLQLRRDLAASLLQMISFNISQIACLNARLHDVQRVYFAGFFIRSQPTVMSIITKAVMFWGKGQLEALFLRHEGYLGAVGSYLSAFDGLLDMDAIRPTTPTTSTPSHESPISVAENFVRQSMLRGQAAPGVSLDFRTYSLEPLAQLELSSYQADTIDLMQDKDARQYWLDCFAGAVDREVMRAVETSGSEKRAQAFKQTYLQHVDILRTDPSAYGELSVRVILELRQQCLHSFQLADIYKQVKLDENRQALASLKPWLATLDGMSAQDERLAVLQGAVAGNCFDWGATAAAERMTKGEIQFDEERLKINSSSWLFNDVDAWLARLEKQPYRKAVVFVDNAGADIVLGMLPLARSLLKMGTTVILAANTGPVLNDITAPELQLLVDLVAQEDRVIANCMEKQ
eukprot:TRINITY_DN11613_c0_g1_i4.p1 TRINITY_DN11613_c0_g1~~TRINITY_DN11613_c0_g1_i4.p1  ORF type:complete len:684 (+),score=186.51 TRINITY_DN11613_c0_g1_i4:2-2053(+)